MGYRCLEQQEFTLGDYKISPLRSSYRYKIMEWRNEQIYHLRQPNVLTKADQDRYFSQVIEPSFEIENPSQVLFSFIKNGEIKGYGGLVHINWADKNAEISFLMKTSDEETFFAEYWKVFLSLIEQVAFEDLRFLKVFTYAFDLRPHLYPILEQSGYKEEAKLKSHVNVDGVYKDVLIHAKFSRRINLKKASLEDEQLTFEWATNPVVRKYSLNTNPITFQEHSDWFRSKINEPACQFYIAHYAHSRIGVFRMDLSDKKEARISYLLDPNFHGMGLGKALFEAGLRMAFTNEHIEVITGQVLNENTSSKKIFDAFGFKLQSIDSGILTYTKNVNENWQL